mmetsp:Transcript_113661/g.222913  ORF Transcript_113661/g.222913 Transcript_113661/m.222913 type:complete len:221 (+) Transcript_113661:86-748(+)
MPCARAGTPPILRSRSGSSELANGMGDKIQLKGLSLQQEWEDDEETTDEGAGRLSTPSDGGSSCSPGSDGGPEAPDTPAATGAGPRGPELIAEERIELAPEDRESMHAALYQLPPSLPVASSAPRAARRVSFAEPLAPERHLRHASPPPRQRDMPMKVPVPAYGTLVTTAPADSLPWKKRPIFYELNGWTSHAASMMYPDLPIHKRPSTFLLADLPRMVE